MVNDIRELEGEPEVLQLRQQDFFQNQNDVYAVLWAAAGGFGDPLERDPGRVEADIHNGDVSALAAREIYGGGLGGRPRARAGRNHLRALRVTDSKLSGKKLGHRAKIRAPR